MGPLEAELAGAEQCLVFFVDLPETRLYLAHALLEERLFYVRDLFKLSF